MLMTADAASAPGTVNGTPFLVARFVPRVGGPVSPLPKSDNDTEPSAPVAAPVDTAPVAAPGRTLRAALIAAVPRPHAPDGDTVIAWAMTIAAAAVILFAAIVSYSHIHALATEHREDSTQAHLLPLSIDGVIAEASLVLLYAARHKINAPKLARVMLWSGIVATLAANAVVALPSSWISPIANAIIGAILSAWPAAAFIGSVELVMLLVRSVRAVATSDTDTAAGDRDSDSKGGRGSGGNGDGDRDSKRGRSDASRGRTSRRGTSRGRASRAGKSDANSDPKQHHREISDRVGAYLKQHPNMPSAEVAQRLKVSKRTVERRRKALAEAGEIPA